MLPFIFEWDWSTGRLIFMGFLYFALTVVGLGLLTAFFMTVKSLRGGGHH
jgi:hypothetical protein